MLWEKLAGHFIDKASQNISGASSKTELFARLLQTQCQVFITHTVVIHPTVLLETNYRYDFSDLDFSKKAL